MRQILLYPGDDGYWVAECPSLPGCVALGNTQVTTTPNFWNRWKTESGQDEFLSGLTLWWNTISYVNIRQVFLPTAIK